jgi:Ca-activated chloride channel family protein
MDEEVNGFTLTSRERGEPAPVLRSVTADSRLDGVLFETTLRQTYRNPSDRVLEVVYTFPLPHGTVLLGFASELNGRRQVGTVVARRDAEQRYEAALAEGDAPVMLEALDHGLHTANIGNLQHDDELVLEVRFAQLVSFEQGRLRLALPTTIAPRFGNPLAAGLQPQQVPQASMAVDYPLALSLTIGAALAGAKVECPTHACRQMASEGGLRIELKAGAALDRDVVFLVQPREPRPSLLVRASDDRVEPAGSVLMAALQPQGDAPPCEAIDLKLLVDCSGSMGGDSIASAQRALLGVLAGLGERDQVSLSRFGHNVEHVQPLAPCRPQLLRQLRLQVGAIAADLGGTVMGAALLAVFRLPAPAGADVLLVTDGEIWEIEQILADARAGGHRVFAIGVGSAPSAGLLQALAEATGGACEFATPGEALEGAAQRMLQRIRQPRWRNVQVDWGAEVRWQTAVPPSLFAGDTALVFAELAAGTALPRVRLSAKDANGRTIELARSEAEAPCPGDALPRIAAAQRLATATPEAALELALRYQLMSSRTNCILVHERADAEKAAEQAELHRVPSMLAAGWGATSSVQPGTGGVLMEGFGGLPMPLRSAPMSAAHDDAFANLSPMLSSVRSTVPFRGLAASEPGNSETADQLALTRVVQRVAGHLRHGGAIDDLPSLCAGLDLPAAIREALDRLIQSGLGAGEAWLLLAFWFAGRAERFEAQVVRDMLRPHFDSLPRTQVRSAVSAFNTAVSGSAAAPSGLSRLERLGQALRKALT